MTDGEALQAALAGKFAVLSAVPFSLTRHVADGAAAAKVHYFDLTEDVETTRHVKALAETAGVGHDAAMRPRARLHLDRRRASGASGSTRWRRCGCASAR